MLTSRLPITVFALASALVAGSLVAAPAASASERATVANTSATSAGTQDIEITSGTVRQAIAEARAAGAVKEDRVDPDGTHVVVIEGPDGVELELSAASNGVQFGSGSDGYGGMFVAFNAFDQNLIISGAMTAIASGLCALGPAVCAVAQVAAVLASAAIGSSGGVKCGTKSLRVYPISHKKPRCA